ncbi:glycosyltransferase family 1 protein [bacterium]|nr:MAG: glycosyltransferase family 1 protein [bacterium]
MRVAIDARSLSERFTSNYTYWSELVIALGQRSDLELLLISNSAVPPEEVPPNARTVVESSNGRWFSYAVLPEVARREGADVVHVQYTVSPRFRIPVVTMIHDVSFFIEPKWFGMKDRFLLQRTVPAACHRASRVVVPSQTCREELLSYIDVEPAKVSVTLEGTPNRLLDTVPDNSLLRTLVGNAPYVLLVGGASPRKNMAGAVAAVREARKCIPDLRLLITGSLPEKPTENWMVAPGPLSEPCLAAAYRGAHALLHPSLHEGFGLTLLEAMALGCPVVASDRGAIPEVAGNDALLYDPFDAAGMGEALVQLLNPGLRDRLAEQGRERSHDFSWYETAEATVLAYRAAVGHS